LRGVIPKKIVCYSPKTKHFALPKLCCLPPISELPTLLPLVYTNSENGKDACSTCSGRGHVGQSATIAEIESTESVGFSEWQDGRSWSNCITMILNHHWL